MHNHYFDAQGVYTHSAPANPGSHPPRNALRQAPPPLASGEEAEGMIQRRVVNATGDGWEIVAEQDATNASDSAPETAAGEERYYLTRAGTYHADGCPYTTAAGDWLDLAAILAAKPSAKPCGRCGPPPLPGETEQ